MSRIKPTYGVSIDESDLAESVERLATSLQRSIDSVTQSPIIAGQLLESIPLSGIAKRVAHKLGRKPLGWIIVNQDENATVYSSQDAKPELFLTLTSSADVVVSLWVF